MKERDFGWWDEFFPAFRPVFGIVSQKMTNAQVRFILKKMDLKPGSKFLDCPCGIGRVAIPMAKAGIKVTGVDITESYLKELSLKAKKQNVKIELHHGDMRRINFDSQFDAAGNIWTSFGFFQKESDNLLVLKKMYKALKPGGKFLLHIINRDWLMAHFESHCWFMAGDMKVLQENGFDYATSTSIAKWTLIQNGQEHVFNTTIRMYSYHELLTMFRQVGFVEIDGFGSVKGDAISRESRMLFVVGTRPGKR